MAQSVGGVGSASLQMGCDLLSKGQERHQQNTRLKVEGWAQGSAIPALGQGLTG